MNEALFSQFTSLVNQYGYLAIGIVVFLECSVFLGLFVPGETFVIFGGLFAAQGHLDWRILFPVVLAGGYLGDLTGYFIGYVFGETVLQKVGKRFGYKEQHFKKAHAFFERWGALAVIIGRFLSLFRSLLPATIGTVRYGIQKYILFDFIGTFLWSCTFVFVGYYFGESWERFGIIAPLIIVGTFVLGFVVVYFMMRSKHD